MLTKRIIACLDVDGARVVKGVEFVNLADIGDPIEMSARYEADGADEIVFLDVSATNAGRATVLDVVLRTAERLFIPLTVGGGMRTVNDVDRALRSGADKIGINSAGVKSPALFTECADRFGSQCVVASVDARRSGDSWTVYVNGGREDTGLDAIEWAVKCAELGAGELLVTSIDRDGSRNGYDLELVRRVAGAVDIPVIASGGAGNGAHLADAFRNGADAALIAGILHDGSTNIPTLKSAVAREGIDVREAA